MISNYVTQIVNVQKLNEEIEIFCSSKEKSPYLIMAESTLDIMSNILDVSFDSEHKWAWYKEYKILCDNTLKYGEIDIR